MAGSAAPPDLPPAALVSRFAGDLAPLIPADPPGARVGLAVSGGPDSVAMLLLAAAAIPGRIAAATVDHGLRAESADEAALVAELCARMGVPHRTLAVLLAPGNTQRAARQARYAALGEWGAELGLAAIATAHHADDQAETLLMRLNRGSGLGGLAGIRPAACLAGPVPVVRPLLGWRRAELAAVVTDAQLEVVDDPTNADLHYDRARMRGQLAAAPWLDAAALARSAGHLEQAAAALAHYADAEWRAEVSAPAPGRLFYRRSDAPAAIRLLVLERALAQLGGRTVLPGDVARLDASLVPGARATLAGVIVTRTATGDKMMVEPGRVRGSTARSPASPRA